jgi:hypothetical protein
MAHRIHRVTPSREADSTHVIGANDNLPAQVSFLYEELMDWVSQFRDEIADLQERMEKLEGH